MNDDEQEILALKNAILMLEEQLIHCKAENKILHSVRNRLLNENARLAEKVRYCFENHRCNMDSKN
jgi:hypothetical protein